MKLFWPLHQEFACAFAHFNERASNKPFSEEIIAFTQALSKRFVRMRHIPEIVALGYWLRKANIQQMRQDFEGQVQRKVVKARGIVFHIAPSNVDTIFVYSWMLSLLAGNCNIIRVSSKELNGLNILIKIIVEELSKPEFFKVAQQTIICTYEHDEVWTNVISAKCHTRVIWGGDETIRAIRQVPLAPLATELVFPDRFSLTILNSIAVERLTEESLNKLVGQFYNDVFWFNQMACSSPRLVIWQGEANQRFWEAFAQKIQAKQYELMAATQVLKYTTTLMLAAEKEVTAVASSPYFSRVCLSDIPDDVREKHCGGGLFYEYEVAKLQEVASIIIDKDQTVAYFGFERSALQQLVEDVSTRGIDRIVPIGQALDFNGVWDGQDFLTSFTREVVIV